MSMLGQVGEIVYGYGNKVVIVFMNWLGSTRFKDYLEIFAQHLLHWLCVTKSYMQLARVMDITIKSS